MIEPPASDFNNSVIFNIVIMVEYCIEVINVWKRYVVREGFRKRRVVEALRGVSFNVKSCTIHALLGPNGAGKTTLVKILSTIILPDSGTARIKGYDVVKDSDSVRKIIGVVLDISKGFYQSMSGLENLIFYGILKGMSKRDATKRAKEVLELVGLDETAYRRPYYTYSLGMRAKISIAKALMTDPDILILDEPTLGLDVESARMIRELLMKLSREGKTILITGHNMHEIESISNYITIIDKGRVIAIGTPEELKIRLGLTTKIELKLRKPDSKVIQEIQRELNTIRIDSNNDRIIIYVKGKREDIMNRLIELLRNGSVDVLDLKLSESTLEDAYLAAIGRES